MSLPLDFLSDLSAFDKTTLLQLMAPLGIGLACGAVQGFWRSSQSRMSLAAWLGWLAVWPASLCLYLLTPTVPFQVWCSTLAAGWLIQFFVLKRVFRPEAALRVAVRLGAESEESARPEARTSRAAGANHPDVTTGAVAGPPATTAFDRLTARSTNPPPRPPVPAAVQAHNAAQPARLDPRPANAAIAAEAQAETKKPTASELLESLLGDLNSGGAAAPRRAPAPSQSPTSRSAQADSRERAPAPVGRAAPPPEVSATADPVAVADALSFKPWPKAIETSPVPARDAVEAPLAERPTSISEQPPPSPDLAPPEDSGRKLARGLALTELGLIRETPRSAHIPAGAGSKPMSPEIPVAVTTPLEEAPAQTFSAERPGRRTVRHNDLADLGLVRTSPRAQVAESQTEPSSSSGAGADVAQPGESSVGETQPLSVTVPAVSMLEEGDSSLTPSPVALDLDAALDKALDVALSAPVEDFSDQQVADTSDVGLDLQDLRHVLVETIAEPPAALTAGETALGSVQPARRLHGPRYARMSATQLSDLSMFRSSPKGKAAQQELRG